MGIFTDLLPKANSRITLGEQEEQAFQDWYSKIAQKTGINSDPDHPLNKYDYRAAYKAGDEPVIGKDGIYHWSSKFKDLDHPNRFVNGIDTITDKKINQGLFSDLVSSPTIVEPKKRIKESGLFSDLIETPSVKEELVGPPMSLAGPQAMIRKMSAGPSPIEKPVAEPTQIPLSGFRPPVIEEPMRLTAGKPSDIKKTKPENWKYYSPIEKFTYNLEDNKLSNIADRFSKQFLNSWSRVGQSIVTHPFSPVGISQKESDKYFNQAMTELQSTGDLPTVIEIRQRANELAAMKKFPTMAVEPRKNKTELVTDVAAGLSSFVVQLALLKKIMPSNTPDAIVWEAQNQITGGTPGEGAAMRLTLGQIGKIPTGKLSGKLAKVGLESSLFAGYSYLLGGDLDEIIISAMIPVTFNAYSFAQMKNHITKYESQLRNDALSAHQRRLQTGMNPATSNAYLKADLRKVDTWVAKAKQKIYQDDAFAPAREKWETIRQNAYKDLGKGGKKAQAAQRVIDWMESQPGGGQQPPTERPIEIKPPITITRPAVGEEALARAKATTIGQPPPVMPQQAPKAVKPAIPEISPTLPVTPGIAQEAPQKPVERRTIPEAPEAKQQEIVQPVTPVTPEKPSKKGYEITQDEIAPIFAKAQANGINANTVINTFQKEFTGVVQNKQEALLAYNMLAEGRTPLEIKTELSYSRKKAETKNTILPPEDTALSDVWKEQAPEQVKQSWEIFQPNEYGYQTREIKGLNDKYFVAQQSPEYADIIESEAGQTKARIKKTSEGKWKFQGYWAEEGERPTFHDTDFEFGTPQEAALQFNSYIKAISEPWRVTSDIYVKYGGKKEGAYRQMGVIKKGKPIYATDYSMGHREMVAQALKEGKPVPHEVLEEYKSEPWAQEALQQAPQKPSEVAKEPQKLPKQDDKQAVEKWLKTNPPRPIVPDNAGKKRRFNIEMLQKQWDIKFAGKGIEYGKAKKIKTKEQTPEDRIRQDIRTIENSEGKTVDVRDEDIISIVSDELQKVFGWPQTSNISEATYFETDDGKKIRIASHSVVYGEDIDYFVGIGKFPDADINISENASVEEIKQAAQKVINKFVKEPTEVYQKEGEKAIDFAKEAAKKKPLGAKEIAEKPRLIKGEGVYLKNNKEYGKLVVQSIDFVKADKVAGVDAQYFITAKDEQGKIITGRPDQFEKASAVDFRESKVETKAKPTEKVKQPVEGNWKLGQERPFKFDANSTKNEGRFRLYPPELITGKYRSQTSIKSRNIPETPGVRFLLSKTKDGKSVIQTIRFDKSMFTEEQAAKWWNENKDRFEFYKPQKAEIESEKVIPAKSVKKEEKPKITLPSEKIPPNQPIQDFGEKIGGARKDYYAMLEKAKDYSIAEHPLSKTFPAPDYQKLIDSGSDPYIVGLVRAMRDEIPSKPQSKWKLNRWIQQVELLRQFAEDLLNEKITKEVFNEKIKTKEFKNLLGPIVGRAELYEIVGHDVSLKGVSFSKHHYSIYRGEENVDKWVVEKKQKATAFSNWPRELAVGNTREEAIANFIEKYKTLKDEDNKSAKIKFTIYSYRKTPGIYWIGKKIGRNVIDLKQFNSAKEAREYRDKNYEELLKLLEKAKYIPEERRAINEQRKGLDHRKGKNVTPEMFTEAFGFRGVEFGNWVAKKGERQKALNDAYDALMDLAMILNIPSQAISLNGELALAFGARGKGGKRAAAAHYEPDRVVINLTRKMGPGSLAHEWWHALDNYFSRRRGKKMGYMTESPYGITDFTKIRKAMWEAFWAIDDAYKKTDIVKRSKELDKRRSTPYWSQSLEITARLFENYVIESLAEKGYSNDYLSNIVAQKEYMSDLAETLLAHQEITAMDVYPYLTEDEKKIVIPAYKKFFNTIEVKQVPGKIYASIGASKSPELDKALQRASKKTKTSYVVQKNGKWIVSSQKPQYGDYYLISANESSLVKGETKFAEKDEAVKAARYMAKSKNGPVYIQKTEKGFILSEQKPSAEHIKIMPESPGLTKAEREYLGKRAQTVIKKAQEKGEKVGFKAGRAEAIKEARQKLDRFMMAVKLTDQLRRDAAEIVKEYIPKELQYRYIKRILEAKTNKRIDNLTKAMNLYLDRAEKKAARKDFVNFIKQTKRKYGRGEVPFGKLRNDVRQELIKVLELYDTMKLSGEKKEELESRDEYIKRIAGTVADAFESLEDMGKDILQMPSARIEELDRLRKIHIGELDADQIRYIQSSLDHLIKIAERKGDIKNRIKAEKLGKLINTARQEVHDKSKKPGVTTELTGVLGLVPRALSTAQATPHTLTGYITGKDNKATMEIINDNLVNMTKDKNNIIKNFVESYRKMLKDAGLTQADEKLLDEKIQIKYGGKTFSSDIDNLLGIYMDIRAEGNLQRILKAGRVFDVYHRDPKWGYIVRHTKIRTGRPGLEELREITDFVENKNPKLKKMADLYFKHNFEIQTPQVNKISMEYQNYELARKEKYWHMSRVMPLGIEGKKTDISISIENQGRFLPRTGGRQPFRNITFRQGVISNLQANAAYSAMTIPMQDIKALISDKRWQDTVIRNGLEKELKTLVVMLRRTQGMITSQDFIDLFGAKVLNNFGKYALSLRLSGYGVQTASIPAAFEIIEPKYFIAPRSIANLPRIPIKDVKEMMELSPTLWMRWTLRQFDYAIGSVASQNAYHNLLWSEKSPTEKLLNHYTWGDQKAIYQIYLATQEKVAAETKLKRGTREFKEAAIKITEDALETQPQWDMIYRNELTSSPNVLLRGSLMFQSARNAQYNVLLRAVDDYKKGRIGPGEAGKRISGVVYANILVAVVKRLIKIGIFFGALGLLYLISDEKEKKEKIKRTFRTKAGKVPGQVAIDSALNFISLPAFGSLTQNIAYETIQRIKYPNMKKDLQDIRTGNIFTDLTLDVTGLVADTGLMTKYLITGEKFKSGKDEGKPKWKRSAIEVADQLAELIAIRTGLPYSAPKGEIYYQIRSAEKSIEKTMSDRELIIAFKKTKTKNGVVKKGMEKKNRELYEEIQKRKKQRQ